MEDFFPTLLEALKTTGLLIWYTLWAFILGYLISAGIQTLVTREQMASVLQPWLSLPLFSLWLPLLPFLYFALRFPKKIIANEKMFLMIKVNFLDGNIKVQD